MRFFSISIFFLSFVSAVWAITPSVVQAQAGCTGGCHEVNSNVTNWQYYNEGKLFSPAQGVVHVATGPSQGTHTTDNANTVNYIRCANGAPNCPIGPGGTSEGMVGGCAGSPMAITRRYCDDGNP
tara:strand:+ start:233 stop:607 length:375 start_codon:yes stop_codon:yes gene_type:complete